MFEGRDLVTMSERGAARAAVAPHVASCRRAAMNALDPVHAVGAQMLEVLCAARRAGCRVGAHARAEELMRMVGLDPQR